MGIWVGKRQATTALLQQRAMSRLETLASQINATPEQVTQLKALQERRREQVRAMLKTVRPGMMMLGKQIRKEVKSILTPEQIKQLRQIMRGDTLDQEGQADSQQIEASPALSTPPNVHGRLKQFRDRAPLRELFSRESLEEPDQNTPPETESPAE
jgi:hypothetical protein